MDLLAAPLVFISPEGKQASFIQTGKHQISLAKKKYPVLLFTYLLLQWFEVYPEALVPKTTLQV